MNIEQMDQQTYGQMEKQANGKTKLINGQMEIQTYGQMNNGQMDQKTNEKGKK